MAAPPPVVVASYPIAAPTAVPPGVSQPITPLRSRRVLGLAVVGVGVAIAIGTAAWLSTDATKVEATGDPLQVQARDLSGCAQLQALAGAWVFTTATTGARRKPRLGQRGFYQLQIELEGCTAHASMVKTGRTDRVVFDDHKIPRAEAMLTRGQGAEAYGWTGDFVLRNLDGQGIDTHFVFALEGERLVGSWRQLGERWTSSGLYGVLEGQREGDPTMIEPSRSTQPCTVRCAAPEDIAAIDSPDSVAHAACLASCE